MAEPPIFRKTGGRGAVFSVVIVRVCFCFGGFVCRVGVGFRWSRFTFGIYRWVRRRGKPPRANPPFSDPRGNPTRRKSPPPLRHISISLYLYFPISLFSPFPIFLFSLFPIVSISALFPLFSLFYHLHFPISLSIFPDFPISPCLYFPNCAICSIFSISLFSLLSLFSLFSLLSLFSMFSLFSLRYLSFLNFAQFPLI